MTAMHSPRSAGRPMTAVTMALMELELGKSITVSGRRCQPSECHGYGCAMQLQRRTAMRFSGRKHPDRHDKIIITRIA